MMVKDPVTIENESQVKISSWSKGGHYAHFLPLTLIWCNEA